MQDITHYPSQDRSQPSLPINNAIPLRPSKRHIRISTRRKPQKLIILTIRHLRTRQRRIHTFIAKRDLILLVVVDVRWGINNTEENRHSVPWQLRASKACKGIVVECRSCLWAKLQCGAPGAAFVVWYADAVDVGFLDAWEFADHFGYFGGCAGRGNLLAG